MADIHFLGTCSGTEPMAGMHHSSFVIRTGGMNYWFDAGENCSHTAHVSGIDLLSTRAIFLSHMHIDHTGGLANLLFCFSKLIWCEERQMTFDNTVDLIAPDLSLIGAIKSVACNSLDNHSAIKFRLRETQTHDGLLFEDENIRVTALHNRHLGEDGSNGWHSYSFLIELDGKRIVFSGDVHTPDELDALIGNGCDLLIMETGHHKVEDVCSYAVSHHAKRLIFTHHGREIIGDRAGVEQRISAYPIDIKLACDNMIEEI